MAMKFSAQAGFTLIELMIALVVVSILVAIALPTYRDKVLKAHRTEAKTELLDLAGREERFFNTNNVYSATPADLGYTAFGLTTSGYYTVAVQINSTTMPVPNYIITATAAGTQTNDTNCTFFQLTSQGAQTSTPNATACWQ